MNDNLDANLERLLREAAPQTVEPLGLAQSQNRVLTAARKHNGRKLNMWTASIGVTAVLVGGGTAVMAGNGMETPWGWVADNVFSTSQGAEVCFSGMKIEFEDVVEDSEIVRDARAFVASLDLDTLDTSAAMNELRSDSVYADRSETELEHQALFSTVGNLLWEHLEAKGYVLAPISLYMRPQIEQGCSE